MSADTIELHGRYYDGVTSSAQDATLSFIQNTMSLERKSEPENPTVSVAVDLVQVQPRIANTPRRISWGDQATFLTQDQDGADRLNALLPDGSTSGWISKLEQSTVVALACLVIVVALSGVFAVVGIPYVAKSVAEAAPVEVSDRLGQATLGKIDQLLSPSEIEAEEQASLAEFFRYYGDVETIEFRKAGELGANALTLSGTTIVLTDELIALAEDDEELLAVYFHELGHARLRHVERTILQDASWLVLLTVITGDVSGASELILSLPVVVGQMAYSRDFEREADEFAVASLAETGVSVMKLATILEKLEASHSGHAETVDQNNADLPVEAGVDGLSAQKIEDDLQQDATSASADDLADADDASQYAQDHAGRVSEALFEYFSSHPATQERIEYIRAEAALQEFLPTE